MTSWAGLLEFIDAEGTAYEARRLCWALTELACASPG